MTHLRAGRCAPVLHLNKLPRCAVPQIEFPLPDAKTKRRIFGIHTGRMTLSEDVNLEEFVMAKV